MQDDVRERLELFLKGLKNLTIEHKLYLAWDEEGINILDLNSLINNSNFSLEHCFYSCISQDGGFEEDAVVVKDLIFDD